MYSIQYSLFNVHLALKQPAVLKDEIKYIGLT